MGGLESDLEELYRRPHSAFQVMLASITSGETVFIGFEPHLPRGDSIGPGR
jgi:hypothetical protein